MRVLATTEATIGLDTVLAERWSCCLDGRRHYALHHLAWGGEAIGPVIECQSCGAVMLLDDWCEPVLSTRTVRGHK